MINMLLPYPQARTVSSEDEGTVKGVREDEPGSGAFLDRPPPHNQPRRGTADDLLSVSLSSQDFPDRLASKAMLSSVGEEKSISLALFSLLFLISQNPLQEAITPHHLALR